MILYHITVTRTPVERRSGHAKFRRCLLRCLAEVGGGTRSVDVVGLKSPRTYAEI